MHNEERSIFVAAMLTGLFIGIIDTLICLAYNIGYRNYTGYAPSQLINVSSLIFMINLLQTLVGMLYFTFIRAFKKADGIFLVFVLALTALLAWKSSGANLFDDAHMNQGFHGLLTGIVLVLGISAAFIPVLYHNRKFLEKVI